MTARLHIVRTGAATTIQDAGRFGMLQHGVSASGPMDAGAFQLGGTLLAKAGDAAIEITRAEFRAVVEGDPVQMAVAGGEFRLEVNGQPALWPGVVSLADGDRVAVVPGAGGNYGYLRFDHSIDVPRLMGSRATNLMAGLGGLEGRALRAGDELALVAPAASASALRPVGQIPAPSSGPIRFIWGIHADLFAPAVRQAFLGSTFRVSNRMDRMGVRLDDPSGVFADTPILSLVSDAVVPGDVQILGDGTPIVLMRDHQPTGGYPRIATVITADFDRFAQLRPGTSLAFAPVTLEHAHDLFSGRRVS